MLQLTLQLQAADAERRFQREESRLTVVLLAVATTALLHWQAAVLLENTAAPGHPRSCLDHGLRTAGPAAERPSRRIASTTIFSMEPDAADGHIEHSLSHSKALRTCQAGTHCAGHHAAASVHSDVRWWQQHQQWGQRAHRILAAQRTSVTETVWAVLLAFQGTAGDIRKAPSPTWCRTQVHK